MAFAQISHDVFRGPEILILVGKHSRGKEGPEEGNSLVC